MVRFVKVANGNYYLERNKVRGIISPRNWWFIKYAHPTGGKGGVLNMNIKGVSVPSELVGKRVRIKLEVLE